jgi:hypothetical protein
VPVDEGGERQRQRRFHQSHRCRRGARDEQIARRVANPRFTVPPRAPPPLQQHDQRRCRCHQPASKQRAPRHQSTIEDRESKINHKSRIANHESPR